MRYSTVVLLIAVLGAAPPVRAQLDDDLINSANAYALKAGSVNADGPVFAPAEPEGVPTSPGNTADLEGQELTVAADAGEFDDDALASGPIVLGMSGTIEGLPPGEPPPPGVPTAPGSSSDERIRQRNEDAKLWATRTGYFKFIVDKDSSKMAVFDDRKKIGVFSVAYGSSTSNDSYGQPGSRNTPIGVFPTHAGRPSNNAFTWFIPYDVPGRNDLGIHGPKDVFLGSLLGLIHWTAGCIAMTSRADLMTVKAAHAAAVRRGTPGRLIIGRGIDFRTIPGW